MNMKKLKDICTFRIPKRLKYDPGSFYKIVDATAINTKFCLTDFSKSTNNNTNLLEKNSIVIVSFDYADRVLGYTFYIDDDNKYVAGIDTIILENIAVNPKALSLYLQHEEVKKQITKITDVVLTTSKRINPKNLGEISINVKKIKDIENMLQCIASIERRCEKELNAIKTINKLYSGTKNKIFKNTENWKQKKVCEFCSFTQGDVLKPANVSTSANNDCVIPIYSGSSKNQFFTVKANTPKKYVVYNSIGGNIGKAKFFDSKTYVINKGIIINSNKISLPFLAYYLSYFKPAIEGAGATKFISLKNFSNVSILIPSAAKQEKIVKCFNLFEKNISDRIEHLNNLLLLKTSLLNV